MIRRQSKESMQLTGYRIRLDSCPGKIKFLIVVKSEGENFQRKEEIRSKTFGLSFRVCTQISLNPDKTGVLLRNWFPSSLSGAHFHFPNLIASP
jgi:hypothetical protein